MASNIPEKFLSKIYYILYTYTKYISKLCYQADNHIVINITTLNFGLVFA